MYITGKTTEKGATAQKNALSTTIYPSSTKTQFVRARLSNFSSSSLLGLIPKEEGEERGGL